MCPNNIKPFHSPTKKLSKAMAHLSLLFFVISLTLNSASAETLILGSNGNLNNRASISDSAMIVTVGGPEIDGSKISLIKDSEVLYITPEAEGKNVDHHHLHEHGKIQVTLMAWVVPLRGRTPEDFYSGGISLRTVGTLLDWPLFEIPINKTDLKGELLTVSFQEATIPGLEINNKIEEQERKYSHNDRFRLYYLYFDMYGFRGSRMLLREGETESIWEEKYPEFVIESYRPFNALKHGFECAKTINLKIRTDCKYNISIK